MTPKETFQAIHAQYYGDADLNRYLAVGALEEYAGIEARTQARDFVRSELAGTLSYWLDELRSEDRCAVGSLNAGWRRMEHFRGDLRAAMITLVCNNLLEESDGVAVKEHLRNMLS